MVYCVRSVDCGIYWEWKDEDMKSSKSERLVMCAFFAALICIATLMIQIPSPATHGYIHLGDGFILTASVALGPIPGAVAAGLGSMLADLLTGYVYYAPGTLLIKACMALIAGLLGRAFLPTKDAWRRNVMYVVCGLLAESIMVLGYFGYEAAALGYGLGALASVPANLVQGAVGLVTGVLLTVGLRRIPGIGDRLPGLQ